MDFETLTRFIICEAKVLSGQTFNNFEEFLVVFEEFYSSITNELVRIGYEFANKTELITFVKMVNLLYSWRFTTAEISNFTDNFLYGYTIPQINKEFDLLRFGENYNINIELKSDSTPEEQEQQLRKNHFYLNFLPSKTYYYSISPNTSTYIEYVPEEDKFIIILPEDFFKIIKEQNIIRCTSEEADSFFEIKNYLVSPFNDVQRFMDGKYFLTGHQMQIINEIINSTENLKSFAIKGNPGTGKSLLIYHLAKQLISLGKKVVIIHGAKVNSGQIELNSRGFSIVGIKSFSSILKNSNQYDYIIIDEAQRLRQNSKFQQLTELTSSIISSNTKFIISLDGRQTLSPEETIDNTTLLLEFIKKNGDVFSLKDKFRSNPEMSKFIQLLFKIPIDREIEIIPNEKRNISVRFFFDRKSSDEYLKMRSSDNNWNILNYTKTLRGRYFARRSEPLDNMSDFGQMSHSIIGQEFNNVIVPLDSNFYYEEGEQLNSNNGKSRKFKFLKTTSSYYPLDKMLYQNITRTRENLELVIIENYNLFIEISKLLGRV